MHRIDDAADLAGAFPIVVGDEGRGVVEEEVELRAEGGVPEEGEGGLVRCGEEVDAGVGGEGREEGLRGWAAEGGGVDGGEEDVDGLRGGVLG